MLGMTKFFVNRTRPEHVTKRDLLTLKFVDKITKGKSNLMQIYSYEIPMILEALEDDEKLSTEDAVKIIRNL
jgi:hypothetical protein